MGPGKPTTPPHAQSLPLHLSTDTPVRVKQTSSSSYPDDSSTERGKAVVEDAGEAIPEITLDSFFEDICPKLRPGIVLDHVIAALKRGAMITGGNRWKGFRVDPRFSKLVEDETFRPLQNVAVAIIAASDLRDIEPTVVFSNHPTTIPQSEHRDSYTRPDGYFFREKVSGSHWKHIPLCAEYKKQDRIDDRNDNVSKVLLGMNHCMSNDPRRRFVYGMTIEDVNMRIWYASRANLVVTNSFNFVKDHRTLVRIILSLAYASEAELGWDPTIVSVSSTRAVSQKMKRASPEPCYDITVRNANNGSEQIYRTIRMLSDIGANALRGHGTRVWEAQRLVDGKQREAPVVLKDCWIDDDRPREGDILEEVRRSHPDPEGRAFLDKHLLTVVCHGDVKIDTADDNTRMLMTRGRDVGTGPGRFTVQQPNNRKPGQQKTSTDDKASGSKEAKGDHRSRTERSSVPGQRMFRYHPKVHYRIVFVEVCQALFMSTSIMSIFDDLAQTAQVLQRLHEAGWVHRDISLGNVLERDGVVKLADFEYAKRLDGTSQHEIRTGTADFMAVEVDEQNYIFIPRLAEEDDIDQLFANNLKLNTSLNKTQQLLPPLRYNPLHEFESVWWMGVYVIFRKIVVSVNGEEPSAHDYQSQRHWASNMFENYAKRDKVIGYEGQFSLAIDALHANIFPIGGALRALRARLVDRYREVEKDLENIDHTSAGDLGGIFSRTFTAVSHKLKQMGDIIIGEFPPEKNSLEEPSVQVASTVECEDVARPGCRASSPLTEQAVPSLTVQTGSAMGPGNSTTLGHQADPSKDAFSKQPPPGKRVEIYPRDKLTYYHRAGRMSAK
ncbi:uncharacterized protein FIBRA_00310 [Fibroporia radiculosa]|uniref:Protein kinase domain-containing protein n=1 Tax=Fibroporia radiculosa TaxID=599839 RepID=J7SC08_9APHY|nr:uncharacterized protein FIBRA_00310 [Fibroporia radiculosa]CCL98316.1 predicted protein [Fibroporia radiculosa]